MSYKMKGNALVGQSGGPTSVINSSLAGVVQRAIESPGIDRLYGMAWGIEGFLQDEYHDLTALDSRSIEKLKKTPSSALGSCRYKLKDEDLPKVLKKCEKLNIRFLFLIGGNDTMDTVHRITEYAGKEGYELLGIGIPKTVDNDLFGTDHTPGFPSAARYTALSVLQSGILARDMQKVDQFTIFQTVGRDAGWLAASAAAAAREKEDAPHIILLPERAFDKEKFLARFEECRDRFGFVSIVCGEGIVYADGTPVSASQITDNFKNVEFGAMGGTSAAMMLHRMIGDSLGCRGEFQVTESLSMCAADRAVSLDIDEAYQCGIRGVELAEKGTSGVMVTLEREGGDEYRTSTGTIPLEEAAGSTKPLPDRFIAPGGMGVSQEFLDYLRPLIGPLPDYFRMPG